MIFGEVEQQGIVRIHELAVPRVASCDRGFLKKHCIGQGQPPALRMVRADVCVGGRIKGVHLGFIQVFSQDDDAIGHQSSSIVLRTSLDDESRFRHD